VRTPRIIKVARQFRVARVPHNISISLAAAAIHHPNLNHPEAAAAAFKEGPFLTPNLMEAVVVVKEVISTNTVVVAAAVAASDSPLTKVATHHLQDLEWDYQAPLLRTTKGLLSITANTIFSNTPGLNQ
jgi:hypothetical protein